jgi:CheY-like chemotaxis protein
MRKLKEGQTILMADDDPDDFFLAKDALKQSGLVADFRLVLDGEELMDYLLRRGKYVHDRDTPMPDLILLDLNMPKKDGREALLEIKKNNDLCRIPVVVLTTSKREKDVSYCSQLGASLFMTKPATFGALVELMRRVREMVSKGCKTKCQSP